jgi:hypothetical protein
VGQTPNRLTPDTFLALARTIGISQARAGELLTSCARRVSEALGVLAVPEPFATAYDVTLERIRDIARLRTEPFV